jgi:hypothetical protein
MSDRSLREQRRGAIAGDLESADAHLRSLVRIGQVDESLIPLLAYCGHVAARRWLGSDGRIIPIEWRKKLGASRWTSIDARGMYRWAVQGRWLSRQNRSASGAIDVGNLAQRSPGELTGGAEVSLRIARVCAELVHAVSVSSRRCCADEVCMEMRAINLARRWLTARRKTDQKEAKYLRLRWVSTFEHGPSPFGALIPRPGPDASLLRVFRGMTGLPPPKTVIRENEALPAFRRALIAWIMGT